MSDSRLSSSFMPLGANLVRMAENVALWDVVVGKSSSQGISGPGQLPIVVVKNVCVASVGSYWIVAVIVPGSGSWARWVLIVEARLVVSFVPGTSRARRSPDLGDRRQAADRHLQDGSLSCPYLRCGTHL